MSQAPFLLDFSLELVQDVAAINLFPVDMLRNHVTQNPFLANPLEGSPQSSAKEPSLTSDSIQPFLLQSHWMGTQGLQTDAAVCQSPAMAERRFSANPQGDTLRLPA